MVLGAQRSGTTLVATALAAHPAIALLMEERRGGLFRIAGGKMPAVKLCTPSQVDLDRRWRAIYQLGRRIGWVARNFDYRMPRSRLSLRDMAARAELKAVCLIREPSASLAALRRRENRSDRIGRDILRRTYDIFERLTDEPRIEPQILSFDRFVRDPKTQLGRLCDWLDLPFDSAMLDAPRLNPFYPAETFRVEKAAPPPRPGPRSGQADPELAGLRARYEALLACAL